MRAEENDENDDTGNHASPGLDDGGRLPDADRWGSKEGAGVEESPPDVRRLREASSGSQRLQLRFLALSLKVSRLSATLSSPGGANAPRGPECRR
jgi:hypothetical protein